MYCVYGNYGVALFGVALRTTCSWPLTAGTVRIDDGGGAVFDMILEGVTGKHPRRPDLGIVCVPLLDRHPKRVKPIRSPVGP